MNRPQVRGDSGSRQRHLLRPMADDLAIWTRTYPLAVQCVRRVSVPERETIIVLADIEVIYRAAVLDVRTRCQEPRQRSAGKCVPPL